MDKPSSVVMLVNVSVANVSAQVSTLALFVNVTMAHVEVTSVQGICAVVSRNILLQIFSVIWSPHQMYFHDFMNSN